MAPVALEFRRHSSDVDTLLVSTGQHDEILLSALAAFGLKPDIDLGIMRHGQSLAQVTIRALDGVSKLIEDRKPSLVVGQGDTTTTFVAALAAFYARVPFAHVEAGLRTDTVENPFPEEFNRRVAGLVSALHFPPTSWAKDNLLAEGKDPNSIFVTGNTGIDAVLTAAANTQTPWFPDHSGRVVLLTTHRRENWGEPQRRIAEASLELVEKFPDVLLVVPMHPNPQVRELLKSVLGHHDRVEMIEPPEYPNFVKLMQRCNLILSDSGGVQEEAPAFGIPVLVLRDTTERPEGVTAGTAKLVGTDKHRILLEGSILLGDTAAYEAMAHAVSPYGDGHASARVRSRVFHFLGVATEPVDDWS